MNRASGAVVARYAYGAYGELGTGSASGFPFRFTGQKLDPATGLYRYKARWYDADVGRFLQTGPIGYKDQMNLYAYVANDPVNLVDPTGEYGRGEGWDDDKWQKFDTAQKQAATDATARAGELRSAAAEVRAGGTLSAGAQTTIGRFEGATGAGGDALAGRLEQAASDFDKAATALNDDGSGGYIANAISRPDDTTFGSAAIGGKTMTVNQSHSSFEDCLGCSMRLQFNVGHESLHSAGRNDQVWSGNGQTAYRRGNAGQQEAYRNLPASQRIVNPDHLMSVIYP